MVSRYAWVTKVVWIGLIMVAILIWGAAWTPALAAPVPVQLADEFRPQSIAVAEDGGLLISGSVGKPLASAAAMTALDATGTVKWTAMGTISEGDAFYRDAIYLSDGTIASCRTAEDDGWLIELTKNGERTWVGNAAGNVLDIAAVNDDFVVAQTIESALSLSRYDAKGEMKWMGTIHGGVQHCGILADGDGFIVYGYRTMEDIGAIGIVAAIDDNGTLRWTRAFEWDAYHAAAMGTNGQFMLAGSHNDATFVAGYGADGVQLWHIDAPTLNGEVLAATEYADGYLVALNHGEPTTVSLVHIDATGNVAAEWTVSGEMDYQSVWLLDGPQLITSGPIGEAYQTVIQPIELPQ